MSTITEYMTGDHRRCDEIFSIAENMADQDNWDEARLQTNAYIDSMERHIAMEETIFFPAFEEATGITQGPTQVMREEHAQMNGMFMQLREALEAQDKEAFLEITETLLILMQQHNMKEEGMLYPMADEHMGDQIPDIIAAMEQLSS